MRYRCRLHNSKSQVQPIRRTATSSAGQRGLKPIAKQKLEIDMNTSGTTYSVLRLALLIAPFAIADRANAACAPGSPLNNATVTCLGATANQNGTDGYGPAATMATPIISSPAPW